MSYRTMEDKLLKVFRNNNFEAIWQDGEKQKKINNGQNPNINILQYKVPNHYNLDLVIRYLGMKTKRKNHGLVYDYRVDLNSIAISHANIILDLYNKASQIPKKTCLLENFLLDLAINGDEYTLFNHQELLNHKFSPPDESLINFVDEVHQNQNKKFQREGNKDWNYSMIELAHVIMWIVLQEDINYPMPKYEGRRMPFYRYLEAIYCAKNPKDTRHTLKAVIERALSHSRPPLWYKCNIHYNLIRNLALPS